VLDFDNVDNITNLYQDALIGTIRESLGDVLENMQPNVPNAIVSHDNQTKMNLISDRKVDQSLIYETQGRSRDTYQKALRVSGRRLTFKVGIYNREEYLYYDENISREYIYVSRDEFSFIPAILLLCITSFLDIRHSP